MVCAPSQASGPISGVNPDFGLASTVSIFVFIIVALISYSGFRRTKALEEVN